MKNIHEEPLHSRYIIANEQDLLWGLTVNTVGKQVINKGENYPPTNHPTRYLFSIERGRKLDEYQLLYITQGEGIFTSQSQKKIKVQAGYMFLLFPQEWHTYRPDKETGWEEYWIGFKGENIDNRIKNGFFSKQKPIFHVGIQTEIVQLYNQGIQIAKEQKAGYQQLLAGITNHLLGWAYSSDKHSGFEDLKVADQINRAKIIFSEYHNEGIKAEEVAEKLNMSYSWFRKLFKEYTGFSPAQYVQELRILRAKELLTNTNQNIKEIAFVCGYENAEYFTTAFKNKTGYTPVVYRKFTQGNL